MRVLRHGTLALVAATTVATSFLAPAARAWTPAGWNDHGFALDTAGMQLHQVLERFATEYGVDVVFDVPDRAVKKEIVHAGGRRRH